MKNWLAISILLLVAILVIVSILAFSGATTESCNVLPQPPLVDLSCDKERVCVEICTTVHHFAPNARASGRCPSKAPVFGSAVDGTMMTSFGLPFFRMRRGSRPRLRFVNRTGYSFDLHWHGLNTTADVDGASSQVYFGASTKLGDELCLDMPTINNNAALLWVHAHPMFRASSLVYTGVYGLLDVVDDASRCVDKMFCYPNNRLLLVYQDVDLDCAGRQTAVNLYTDEARSCFGAINGISCVDWSSNCANSKYVAPMMNHTSNKQVVKIDLLNGTSTFRYLHVGVCDCSGRIQPFWLVQSDDGLQNPVQLEMVTIAPASRVALLVDLADFKGLEARVFFYNYDLTEVDNLVATGDTGGIELSGTVPIACNPTPNPTPIPATSSEPGSLLTFPCINAAIPQVNSDLPNGTRAPPTTRISNSKCCSSSDPSLESFTIKPFLRIGLAKNSSCQSECPSLTAAVRAIRQVVFGSGNYAANRTLISTPGFEYGETGPSYLSLLNPDYFYNLPALGATIAFRNFMLTGDDGENSIAPGSNPLGSTEYINGENRIMVDLWNSAELDLATAVTQYNLNPNDYRPAILPTLLFKIYPTVTKPMNYAMLANDTLLVELFSSLISYGDTTTPPEASATVVFPATGNDGQPLNLVQWVALVNAQFATTNIVISNVSTPLSTLLSLQWSFFPWSQVNILGQPITLKTVIMINTNSSAFYVRLRAPWNLLQFLGKAVGADMPPMTQMPMSMSVSRSQQCASCKCGSGCRCSRYRKCAPNCHCWLKHVMSHGKNKDENIQQVWPSYATSDPSAPIFLVAMDALAEMIIAPVSQFRGFVDGFQSDNLLNFSVLLNSTERWIYNNNDFQDSHPLHFHLTSGFVDPADPDNSAGLVSVERAYWPRLYSRDTFGIGPQQRLAFYLKFVNHTSAEQARRPGVANLGFMYHCHYMTHHDMSMMGSYYVFDSRVRYFGP